MKLFETSTMNKVVSVPSGRRRLMKGLLFGASAAAITPILGGVQGVHAATLGINTLHPTKIRQLTGVALKNELKSIGNQEVFKSVESFLIQKGFNPQQRIVEGLEVYTQIGNSWTVSQSFVFLYDADHPAIVNYVQSPSGLSIGLSIRTTDKVKEVYEFLGSKVKYMGQVIDNGLTLTVAPQSGKAFTLKKADIQNLYSTQANKAISVHPNDQCACLSLCAEVTAAGCGFLGAAVECSALCLGPEDLPCLGLCGAMLAVICAVGGIDCANFCSSHC